MRNRIILDNGGGITMQLGDWAHFYDGRAEQCANDIVAWLADPDMSQWDGHDEGAAGLNPTEDDERNGGCVIVLLDRHTDTAASLAVELYDCGGGACAVDLADALNRGEGEVGACG